MTAAYEEELFGIIEQHISEDPRTLQTAPGPSGLGTPCYHCLGCLIAREPRMEAPEDRWLSWIGKCVHEGLAKAAEAHNLRQPKDAPLRFLVEERLVIGRVGDELIEGSSDIYDTAHDRVVDWKVVGDATLRDVALHGPPPGYVGQQDLYCKGWADLGAPVRGWTLVFLPRNKYRMRAGITVHRDYSPANAAAILKRANDIAALLSERGPDYVIPRLKRDPSCRTCPKYPR